MVASSWATTEMLLAVEVTFEFAMSAVRLSAMSLEATAAPIAAAPVEMPTAPAPLPIDESSMAVTVTLPVTVTVELSEMEGLDRLADEAQGERGPQREPACAGAADGDGDQLGVDRIRGCSGWFQNPCRR